MTIYRKIWLSALAISVAAIFFSYFLEYFYQLDLCIFCTLQRWVMILLALSCCSGYFYNYYSWGLVSFFAICGILLGARLIWLQFFATAATLSCTAGIAQIFDFYPWAEAITIIFKARSCAEEVFTLLMVPLSVWTLLVFIVLLGLVILLTITRPLGIKKGGRL